MFQVPSPQGKGGEEEQKTCLSPFHKGDTRSMVYKKHLYKKHRPHTSKFKKHYLVYIEN